MQFTRFHWSRPESVEYPKVWHRFQVKKITSHKLEWFRIQDLPLSRTGEAIKFMLEYWLIGEPVFRAYEVHRDDDLIGQLISVWRNIINQKTVLVCCKETTNEIVGINMTHVLSEVDFHNDNIFQHVSNYVDFALEFILKSFMKFDALCKRSLARLQSLFNCKIFETIPATWLAAENFPSIANDCDGFREFGVSAYLTAGGLAVSERFRHRGIAVQLLKARKKLCSEFNIELTLNRFSSDYANKAADKAGFKLARIRSYDDIRKEHPHLPPVQSQALTYKFMKIPAPGQSCAGKTNGRKKNQSTKMPKNETKNKIEGGPRRKCTP